MPERRKTRKLETHRALIDQRTRLVDLGGGVLLGVGSLFILSNVLHGYHASNPTLIALAFGGLVALVLRTLGKIDLALMLVVATTLVGSVATGLATGDFVRILPWWSYFVLYAAVAYDSLRASVFIGVLFTAVAAVMALLLPTEIIPKQLAVATMAPAATALVVGFNSVSRRRLVDDLSRALDEVTTLHGILPICMYCKKLRDDDGAWQAAEAYVAIHTGAQFATGECESCLSKSGHSTDASGVLEALPVTATPAEIARAALGRQRRTLLGLALALVTVPPGFFAIVNIFRGYWDPLPFQLGTTLLGLALALALRRGLAADKGLLIVVGLMVAGATSITLAAGDFLRIFPAWPTLIFFASIAFDRLWTTIFAMAALVALAAVLMVVAPGVGIPNQLLAAILMPTMTAFVTGFMASSRRRLHGELVETLSKVRDIRGVLPFCTRCKKLRDEAGVWQQLEVYVTAHSDAHFSHGVCEECLPKLEADLGISMKQANAG